MKKQLLIVGLVVILLIVGMGGCINTTVSDEEKLIGTWTKRNLVEDSIMSISYIFYSNKTFKLIILYKNDVNDLNGIWNITNSKLVMISEGMTVINDYSFSKNNKILTITKEYGDSDVFLKEED